MTPSELKYNMLEHNPGSHFFDRATMRYFGDTMANYGVRGAYVQTRDGQTVEAWELYRKRAVKGGLQTSAFFDKDTFCQVFAKKEWEETALKKVLNRLFSCLTAGPTVLYIVSIKRTERG